MSSYTISNTEFNSNKVFILQKSELEKRFDPQFYKQEYKDNLDKIKSSNHKRLGDVVKFSSETWNQKDFFENTFPYIEISEIDTITGEIRNIVHIEKENAASRAKMIVRENDIIVSTTRPNRGAISLIKKEQDISIASTGFSVIRNITNPEVKREYLFAILKQQIILKQLEQRSSGGNYPAITQEELRNIVIPLPNFNKQNKIFSLFNNCLEQKKQNEVEAERLLTSIDDYLLGELGITLPKPPKNILRNRMYTTSLKNISGNRFDPYHHQRNFGTIISAIKKSRYDVVNLKHIIRDLKNGIEIRTYVENSGIRYLRVTDLGKNGINSNSPRFILKQEIPERIKLNKNCILISRSGSLGLVNVVDTSIENTILSSHIFKVELKSDKITPTYLETYLRSKVGQSEIFRNNNGGVIPEINQKALKSIFIVKPPLDKQKEIANHITAIRKQAQDLKDKTKDLLKEASKEIEKILIG